ncbi:hypothetical protein [Methylobacterium sp. Leaf118]|uniref:hypothetical protein n=1 Tax=Methylobacterium sp. Leaf118 TaxID=2876562 RepID=UPI001E2B588D|nr:hypothetical protein [Methylobacterium sp. Leaf118]
MGWNLYDVSVQGYGTEVITAPSRGKALAAAWRSDAFSHISFGAFLRITSLRRREVPPTDDGYGYVRQRYEVDPQVGQRVTYTGCGSSQGQAGTILYPGKCTAHVLVLIDGREHPVGVHPTDLAYSAPAPSLPSIGRAG